MSTAHFATVIGQSPSALVRLLKWCSDGDRCTRNAGNRIETEGLLVAHSPHWFQENRGEHDEGLGSPIPGLGKAAGKNTEQARCDNAVSVIRNAIKASDKLRARSVSVFAQGSYRSNTNIRQDSDVDIGVICADTFFFALPEGTTRETFGFGPGTYGYDQYKNEV